MPLVYPGQYEVSVHSGGFSASRAFCSDTAREPAKISIFGSCTTRDCFRLLPADAFELKSYIARQSVVSAVSGPVPLDPASLRLTSPFQKKAVEQDFHKSAFDTFREDGSQWLIIDLIDERFPLAVIRGSYVTGSTLALDGGAIPRDTRLSYKVKKGGDYFIKDHCIREDIERFCKELLRIYAPDHIIIHQAYAVDRYWDKDGRLKPYEKAQQGTGRTLNNVLNYMYRVLRENLPQAHVIDCMDGWHGTAAHTWGLAAIHYEDGYYAEVIRRLGEIIFGGS